MEITEKDRKTLKDLYWTVVKLGLGGNTVREHMESIVRDIENTKNSMTWIGKRKKSDG